MGAGIIPAIVDAASSVGDFIGSAASGIGDALSSGADWLGNALGISGTGPSSGLFGSAGPLSQLLGGFTGASQATGATAPPSASPTGGTFFGVPAGSGTGGGGGGGGGGGALGGMNLGSTLRNLAALGLIGSEMFGRPGYGSMPKPSNLSLGPLMNAPLRTSGYINRSAVPNYQPQGGDWYTYGEQPQGQFFTGNQISFPPASGMAGGGALSHELNRPVSTRNGDNYVHGDDPGMDDSRDARLSDGEFIFSAQDTANAGDGNNNAGARVLQHMRKKMAEDKGFKHPVPPKLKQSPLSYLSDARKEVLGHE